MKRSRQLLSLALVAAIGLPQASGLSAAKVDPQRQSLLDRTPPELQPIVTALYDDGEWGAVLNLDRLAVEAMHIGRYDIARRALDASRGRIDAVYANTDSAKKARSKFSGEGVKDFKGEPYERAMTYYYLGLLFMADGDYQNARAAFRSAEWQDTLSEAEEFESDFGIMNLLAGWATSCDGEPDRAQEYYDRAKKKESWLTLPQPGDNTLLLVEAGSPPTKSTSGKYGEELVMSASSDQYRLASLRPMVRMTSYAPVAAEPRGAPATPDPPQGAGAPGAVMKAAGAAGSAAVAAAPAVAAAHVTAEEPAPPAAAAPLVPTPPPPPPPPAATPTPEPTAQPALATLKLEPVDEPSGLPVIAPLEISMLGAKAAPPTATPTPTHTPTATPAPASASVAEGGLPVIAPLALDSFAPPKPQPRPAQMKPAEAPVAVTAEAKAAPPAAPAAAVKAPDGARNAADAAAPAAVASTARADQKVVEAAGLRGPAVTYGAPELRSIQLARLSDVSYQATTRGGRPVDVILKGKAKFKQGTETAANVALAGANAALEIARTTSNLDIARGAGIAGGALAVVGLFSSILSEKAEPKADNRYWDNLPSTIYGSFLKTDLVAKTEIDFRPAINESGSHGARVVLDKPSGACRLVLARLSASPNPSTSNLTEKEKRKVMKRNEARDAAFRNELLNIIPPAGSGEGAP